MKIVSIVDKKSKSPVWSVFGLPAKILGDNKFKIIEKFASCKKCCQTYVYSSSTTTLASHKCSMILDTGQSILQASSRSKKILNNYQTDESQSITTNAHQFKINQKPKSLFTTLLSDWVCTNIRPINIIDDCGLTELFDYCVQIGKFILA